MCPRSSQAGAGGNCIRICPVQAISMRKMKIVDKLCGDGGFDWY